MVIESMDLSSTVVDQLEEILFNMDRAVILSTNTKEIVKLVQE